MKRISTTLALLLVLTTPALAVNSIAFSTPLGAEFSWELMNVGGTWQLSFVDDAIVVDDADPMDPVAVGDFVSLPTMTLTDFFFVAPGVLMTTLTPQGNLTIVSDTGNGVAPGDTVLTASVAPGMFLNAGTNFIAYSAVADDLDVLDFAAGYGTVIPLLAGGDAAGLPLDLSFSGDAMSSIFTVLTGTNPQAVVTGNISGAITVIPSPGALLLAAIGTVVTGWLRQRKSM